MKQAFYDDRKGRAVVDERERAVRAARAAGELPESSTRGGPGRGMGGAAGRGRRRGRPQRSMPGPGQTLSGKVIPAKRRASQRED